MGIVRFFQPLKSLLLLAQPGVDEGDFVPAHAILLNMFFQFGNGLLGIGRLAGASVGIAQMAERVDSLPDLRNSAIASAYLPFST